MREIHKVRMLCNELLADQEKVVGGDHKASVYTLSVAGRRDEWAIE